MKKNNDLPYSPGVIPTKPPPKNGENILIKVKGYPPYKDLHFSIRNPRHPNYNAFLKLRNEAIKVMSGRTWWFGPIEMELTLYAPKFENKKSLSDYISGIADTLDGSSGRDFTYLPIVFEDDCQIFSSHSKFIKSKEIKYEIKIKFIRNS